MFKITTNVKKMLWCKNILWIFLTQVKLIGFFALFFGGEGGLCETLSLSNLALVA